MASGGGLTNTRAKPIGYSDKPAPDSPTSTVLPFDDAATLAPKRRRGSMPASFLLCETHCEPVSLKTHAAPVSASLESPPITAVWPSGDKATPETVRGGQ